MKNFWLFLPVFCLFAGLSSLRADRAQTNFYQYFIDLEDTDNDRLKIELITPQLADKKARFLMPKIIPGTYTVYDFGRFVSDFKAYDQSGQELEVVEKDVNTWEIQEAQRLYRLEYWVDDTFDATTGKPVSGMSGTNIEKGKNYLFNFHGFLGYLEDYSRLRFEVSITSTEGLSGSSAQAPIRTMDNTSVYEASDYNFLVDNPVMYCKADTTSVRVGNAEVLISVFSPGGNVESSYVADQFRRLLDAQQAYLGGELPVDRYAFLMYFLQQNQAVGTGALEHNYSSVYVLPDLPQEQISPMLVDIAAHEFFHIVTPLTVHSEEIHYFDFNDPDMSQHLWMYEGLPNILLIMCNFRKE
jgi:predicted metalloprotease with PDZ domain